MEEKRKTNIKSNSGFTMTDLVIALSIFTIFTGIIGTIMYSSFKLNLQTKMSGVAANYAIQILEDIDKISYEEVTNGMENKYINKFSIPDGFKLTIEVSKYNNGNSKQDLIKKVKLTITYNLSGSTESFVVQRLKIKEV